MFCKKISVFIIFQHFKNNENIIIIFINLWTLLCTYNIFLNQRVKFKIISEYYNGFRVTQSIDVYPCNMSFVLKFESLDQGFCLEPLEVFFRIINNIQLCFKFSFLTCVTYGSRGKVFRPPRLNFLSLWIF